MFKGKRIYGLAPLIVRLVFGVLIGVLAVSSCQLTSEPKVRLRIMVDNWGRGSHIKLYLAEMSPGDTLWTTTIRTDGTTGRGRYFLFALDTLSSDTALSMTLGSDFLFFSEEYDFAKFNWDDKMIRSRQLQIDSGICFSKPTLDGGVVYCVQVENDYSGIELTDTVGVYPGEDITELVNPLGWEFERAKFYESGAVSSKWIERFDSLGILRKHGLQQGWSEEGRLTFEMSRKMGRPHGLLRRWSDNGKLLIQAEYSEGKKEGIHREWYLDGRESSVIGYRHDLPHGLWTRYDVKGNLIDSGSYENGTGTLWYANGQKASYQEYLDGKKQGAWFTWFADGVMSSEVHYEDNRKVEVEKHWFKNGQISSEQEYDGTLCHRVWYESGQIRLESCRGSEPRIVKRWYETGQISYERRVDSVQEFIWRPRRGYSPVRDSLMRMADSIRKVNSGELEFGFELEWYVDGTRKSEREFRHDRRKRSYVEYYPNSSKKLEGQYVGRLKVGIWVEWRPQGTKSSETDFSAARDRLTGEVAYKKLFDRNELKSSSGPVSYNGLKVGKWEVFDSSGIASAEQQWKNGVLMEETSIVGDER